MTDAASGGSALYLHLIGLTINYSCVFHLIIPSISLIHCCLSEASGTLFTDLMTSLSTGMPDSMLSAP